LSTKIVARTNCRFQFQKRRQLFTRAHNETLSFVAVRVRIQIVGPLESIGLPIFAALLGERADAIMSIAKYRSGYPTVLKRWRIMQTSLVPPLNKADLTSRGSLPCPNDNKFLIIERG
jgi:hypothetical protein